MGVRNPNSTSYVHPDEPNLLNLHKAMEYDVAGLPHIRVTLGTDNITITGNVNLVDSVRINNTDDQSIPVHLTDDPIAVTQSTDPWKISGNVGILGNIAGITSLPAITGTITGGNINANVSGNVIISGGNVNANVSGSVIVSSGNVNANVSGNVVVTSGNININSLPAITGNVVISGNANIVNTPNVWITNKPDVTGNIIVSSGNINANVTQGTNPWIVSGNVNANVTQGTNPWIVQGNVTINQDANVPSLVKYINTPNNLQLDMTQRLRVSPPLQTWWYAPTIDKDTDLRYIESNVGANSGSIFVQNLASINMSSGTDSNGSFIRISRRRHKMRPGVGMSCTFSINWNGYVSGNSVVKRVGMFTNFNGVFFEMTTDLQIVIRRRLTDGTLVEKRILRENFNIDALNSTTTGIYDLRPLVINTSTITAFVSKTSQAIPGDGTVYKVVFTVADPGQFYVSQKGRITGLSPILYNGTVMVTNISGNNITVVYNIDPGSFSTINGGKFEHTTLHKQYVFGFDFNGNRATSIRFFIDGPKGRTAIHQEDFGGEMSTPFSNAPAVSTRYEISCLSAPGFLPSFTASSEVVKVEAEAELNPGFGTAANNIGIPYTKTKTEEFAILGIGLRAGEPYQRADMQLQSVQITDIHNINPQNSGVLFWRLLLNPTLGGDYTAPGTATQILVGKTSRCWRFTTSTTFSGGIELMAGYSTQAAPIDVRAALNFINLGSNIEYTDADKIVLVVRMLAGGSADSLIVANMNFIEAL